jgi:branched-chain amino acid transport system permease protein
VKRGLLLLVLLGAALAVVPWLRLPAFYESLLYLVFHWAALATSWNLLSGYSGYFSFGHGAFFGAGMYTTANLASKFDWPFLWTLPVAAAVAAVLGAALGAVAFRVHSVRGELFALLTLALTFVVATVVGNTPIDGGPGVYLSGVPLPGLGPTPSGTFYLLALGFALLALAAAMAVYHSRLGLGLFAIHDDEDVAEVMGVPTFRYKLGTFALSCALAGAVGGVHAMFVSYVTTQETFGIVVPLTVVLMSVLGGARHWAGPAIGAAVITALLYAFTAGDNAVVGKAVIGVVLIAVILFLPQGLIGPLLARRARRAAGQGGPASPPREAAASSPQQTAASAHATAQARLTGVSLPPARPADTVVGAPLLRVRGVSKSFKAIHALREVSFEVRRGEILGLVGPNGSGKSTMINCVSGHLALSAGHIEFDGRPVSRLAPHRIARAGIARTYQIPRPFAQLTVLQNVALPGMFGAAALDRRTAELEAMRLLEFTGLAGKAYALPDDLNLHQRKFLEFARALASRPALLMLDEVLSGLTPSEIDEAVATIRRIRDAGTTIVFVEHVMRAVMAMCDRVVVLNRGELLAEGVPHEVMQRPDVVAAYLGKPADRSVAAAPPSGPAPLDGRPVGA